MLSLYVRVPFIVLGLIESLLCVLAVFLAVQIRFQGNEANIAESFNHPWMTSLTFTFSIMFSMVAVGLYQFRLRSSTTAIILRIGLAVCFGWIGAALVFYFVPNIFLGRGASGLAAVIVFFMLSTIRPLFFRYVDADSQKKRIIVFGAGEQAALVRSRLRRRADRRGFIIVGYLPFLDTGESVVEGEFLLSMHQNETLLECCQRHGADEILVAFDNRRASLPIDDLVDCRFGGLTILDVPGFFEREASFVPLESVVPSWLAFTNGFNFPLLQRIFKRIFDLFASFLLLFLCWPVMLLAALAIGLECQFKHPILYRQIRVGRYGRHFSLYKFRSMRIDAEANGAIWASSNDNRVTKIGSFLRNKRIDELPQLWNVLAGDMSFVGPRPERPEFVEQLLKDVPYYHLRHQVKPGITGWAQLSYPYGSSADDAWRKHEYDLYYVKHHDIFLDFLIMVLTVEVVLFGKGAR